ncbi:uncharacterized protein SCHCODRAFT_02628298 [Schizophyllum commune H4-8]|uniref:uncharacterized protein n=1 Tax=Schizophyllum commune (strain H4-8 / FGSC 9210) TaxID=578458 RepID=UPI0021609045|nr:uncharacterized protein SCHCODRAFT_02628298 [Schizophyllum commune H4-8]KAI5891176.1 hypothetical protein SCHCODRAFT_02628298 [Schizophyllum commune H4-8]
MSNSAGKQSSSSAYSPIHSIFEEYHYELCHRSTGLDRAHALGCYLTVKQLRHNHNHRALQRPSYANSPGIPRKRIRQTCAICNCSTAPLFIHCSSFTSANAAPDLLPSSQSGLASTYGSFSSSLSRCPCNLLRTESRPLSLCSASVCWSGPRGVLLSLSRSTIPYSLSMKLSYRPWSAKYQSHRLIHLPGALEYHPILHVKFWFNDIRIATRLMVVLSMHLLSPYGYSDMFL